MLINTSILHDKRQCMGQTLWPLNTESYNFEDILRSESGSAANIYMFVQRIFANTQTKLATLCDQQHGVYEEEKLKISSLTNFVLIFPSRIKSGTIFCSQGTITARIPGWQNPEIQTRVDTHLTFIAVTVLTVWGVTIISLLFQSINRFQWELCMLSILLWST